MNKIFQNNKEPLFGRADNIIELSPFSLPVLREIIHDYHPTYTNDDLLELYTFTGGVPKYVELFCDNRLLDIDGMINFMVRDNSPFTDEGKNLLIEEFGKNYATYFSILSAISNGKNTQAEIETVLGNKSIGGYLKDWLKITTSLYANVLFYQKRGHWLSDMKYRIILSVSGLTISTRTVLLSK